MKSRNFGLLPAGVLLALFVLGPLFTVLVFSFMKPGEFGGVVSGFSLDGYIGLLFERDFDDVLVFQTDYLVILSRSLFLAVTSTVLCVLIGFPVAYFIAGLPKKHKSLILLIVTIPFWTNLLVRTLAWANVLQDVGFINEVLMALRLVDHPVQLIYNKWAVLVGVVYSFIPFFILPVYASLDKLKRSTTEAAWDLYATQWKSLWYITIPLVRPAIFSGCFLVFIPSMGAFLAPDILGGSKELYIGNSIVAQFTTSRNWPLGSALSMVLMVFIMMILIFEIRNNKYE